MFGYINQLENGLDFFEKIGISQNDIPEIIGIAEILTNMEKEGHDSSTLMNIRTSIREAIKFVRYVLVK